MVSLYTTAQEALMEFFGVQYSMVDGEGTVEGKMNGRVLYCYGHLPAQLPWEIRANSFPFTAHDSTSDASTSVAMAFRDCYSTHADLSNIKLRQAAFVVHPSLQQHRQLLPRTVQKTTVERCFESQQ